MQWARCWVTEATVSQSLSLILCTLQDSGEEGIKPGITPKYLMTLLMCPKGKVEGAVCNRGFNLNQKKGVRPWAIKEASSK